MTALRTENKKGLYYKVCDTTIVAEKTAGSRDESLCGGRRVQLMEMMSD